jgi:uncharacterized protein YecT (DUF1311 family)
VIGKTIFTVVAIAFAAVPALAADSDCQKETSQMGLNECFGKLADAADAELNKAYKALAAKSEGQEKDALRDAQRAWIAYRDKECDYETIAEEGGSIRPMEISICVAEKTAARTKEFKSWLSCAPSDLSCTH